MIEKSPLSTHQIIDCLKINYGINVSMLNVLPLGADMEASVYKAETCNQSCYFIKVKWGYSQDISTLVMELLESAEIQHIIPPIKTLDGQTSHHVKGFTFKVFPFIQGQNGFSCVLTDAQWEALGKVMRQIHEIKVPSSIQSKLGREVYSSTWRQAVRTLYPLIESKPRGDISAVGFLTFVKKHAVSIYRLVDQAEQLAQKVQNETSSLVLCHSDIHGGNVLLGENNIFYIVDWDDPIMAPKERDLMFIGGGVGGVWNKLYEEKLFYKGYGKTEVNRTLLAYYRHERIIEDIAFYGEKLLLTAEGGEDRVMWYNQFRAQFEPQGVVEIAFKTNKNQILEI